MKFIHFNPDGSRDEWEELDPVPQSVTNFQARAALMDAGLFEEADSAVRAAGGIAFQAWEYAGVFERRSPLIDALGKGLGLSDAEIDGLFIAAAGKTA